MFTVRPSSTFFKPVSVGPVLIGGIGNVSYYKHIHQVVIKLACVLQRKAKVADCGSSRVLVDGVIV
jgi:hypothetical protein